MSLLNQGPGPHFLSRKFSCFHNKVPFIFTDLIARLEEIEAVKLEGIFRLSGQKSVVENLCRILDNGHCTDWEPFSDPNVVACALKRYIRELSAFDPIIGEDVAGKLTELIQNGEGDLPSQMNKILAQTPISRRNSLAVLCCYLHKVALNSGENRMEASNLSICFAPAMFPRTDAVASGNSMKAIEMMIDSFDAVFDPSWYSSNNYMTDADINKVAEPDVDFADALNESERRRMRKESLVPFDREDLATVLYLKRPERPPPPLPTAAD